MKAGIKITLLVTCMCVLLIQTYNEIAFGETYTDENGYQKNEIIVSFNKDIETTEVEEITDGIIDHVIDNDQDDTIGAIESGTPVLINTDDLNIVKLAHELSREKVIDYAQPNYIYVLDESCKDESVIIDDDLLTRAQWNLKYMNVYEAWNLIDALDIGRSDRIGIATIDTGVTQNHEDMQINLDKERCFQTVSGEVQPYTPVYGHGTGTTSLIAADSNNEVGIDGIAAGNNNDLASVFGINVFENKGRKRQCSATTSDIIAGLDCANTLGAKVINMSLGYNSASLDVHGNKHNDVALENKLDELYKEGIVIVCSAGNKNNTKPWKPSDFRSTISVMATKHYYNAWANVKKDSSNYGKRKNLCAPGKDIPACSMRGRYRTCGATSAAAPQTASVAALMLCVDHSLNPGEVCEILCSTATDVYTEGPDLMTGAGVVNAYNAVVETARRAVDKGSLRRSDGSLISEEELESLISETKPAEMAGEVLAAPRIIYADVVKKRKKKTIVLNWEYEKPAHVNSIRVYRSTSKNGKYKCVKIINRESSSWANKKLKKSKKYYYKIRIFGTTSDGKKVFSPFSEVQREK